jgi:hypothetical protein
VTRPVRRTAACARLASPRRGPHLVVMSIDATMALAVATAGSVANRRARRSSALTNILARQQARAAALLHVAPLPMRAARVASLATDGAEILYSEGFLLRTISRMCEGPECAVSAVLGMVAHELAHAYLHRDVLVHHYTLELEADWIAGWVLGRAGVCPGDFIRVLEELIETPTHPHPRYRAASVTQGFARGTAARAVP